MGLGYTALEAARRGATVITVEVSPEVLMLAEHNPFSRNLRDTVTILHGDVSLYVRLFKDNTFDKIVHDPPRYTMAGELYSLEFYRELYRILRPGGVLLHYTGEPLKGRGRGHGPIVRGILERLSRAGFIVKGFRENILSVIAVKPRRRA
jgi:predicted methyltransferase